MVIERQQIVVALLERVGLTDELQRAARVLAKDHLILIGRGVEEGEDGRARRFDVFRRGHRGGVGGVWIAKDVRAQQLHMRAHLGLGVDATPSVVQVDVPLTIQPPIFGRAQVVQMAGRRIRWRLTAKGGFGLRKRLCHLR